MNKRIVAESHISKLTYLVVMLLGTILLAFVCLDRTCIPTVRAAYLINFLAFAYWGYKEINNTFEYLRLIEIKNNNLILRYFNITQNKESIINIPLKDIQKVTLNVWFHPLPGIKTNVDLTQTVCIYYNNRMISFSVTPSVAEISLRKWNFALRFLSIAKYLPNFEYSIDTNEEGAFIKRDINYFYENNKKYPYILNLAEQLGYGFVIFMAIVFIAILICLISLAFENISV
ncbi:hypothetical protein IJD34_00725 [bacterium]|nr:hypothetical protein [bacterium]